MLDRQRLILRSHASDARECALQDSLRFRVLSSTGTRCDTLTVSLRREELHGAQPRCGGWYSDSRQERDPPSHCDQSQQRRQIIDTQLDGGSPALTTQELNRLILARPTNHEEPLAIKIAYGHEGSRCKTMSGWYDNVYSV